jgi:hypothetical protein
MLMIDLCAGLGGAHQAMRPPKWKVISVDNDPRMPVTVVADIRTWHYQGPRPDLIWASPTCTEFARESMPWFPHTGAPDLSLMLACKRIIDEAIPNYWIIENVRGAVPFFRPYLGQPTAILGPFYLWGHYPNLNWIPNRRVQVNKEKLGPNVPNRAAIRGKIPYIISARLAEAIECQQQLWPQGI